MHDPDLAATVERLKDRTGWAKHTSALVLAADIDTVLAALTQVTARAETAEALLTERRASDATARMEVEAAADEMWAAIENHFLVMHPKVHATNFALYVRAKAAHDALVAKNSA